MRKDKTKNTVRHNVIMRLLQLEREGNGYNHNNPMPLNVVDEIRKEANTITERIYPEYAARNDAPLWLYRKLKDMDWLIAVGQEI